MTSTKSIVIVSCLAIGLSSCTALFNAKQKATFTTTEDVTKIELRTLHAGRIVSQTIEVATEQATLKTYEGVYLATQKCDSCLTQITPVFADALNKTQRLDIGVPLGAAIVVLTLTQVEDAPYGLVITSGLLGSYGWLGLLATRKYVFAEQQTLETPPRIPNKETLAVLNINSARIDLEKSKFQRNYYGKLDNWVNSDPTRVVVDDDVLHVEINELVDDVTKLLGTNVGANQSVSPFQSAENGLEMKITEVIENHVSGKFDSVICFDLTSEWTWYDFSKNSRVTDTYTVRSNWVFAGKFSDDEFRQIFANAVAKSLLKFGEESEYLQNLMTASDFLKVQDSGWEEMVFKKVEIEKAQKLATTVNSVVTIIHDNGHGSGCIVTADGYIITSHHVVSVADSLWVKLPDGTELPLKIIRTNPYVDLALLKLDGIELSPLPINADYGVGDNIFAIGTPADIEFGQSVAQGIISAVRKEEDLSLIQTDVSLSPGVSGGGLINNSGELIGIIKLKIDGFGVEGIGFGVPISTLEKSLKIRFE